MKILIDPGHGGKDPGAINSQGITEASVNLSYGLELAGELYEQGIAHKMTRTEDVYVRLSDRAKMAQDCSLLLSIHCNSASLRTPSGSEVLHYGPDTGEYAQVLALGLSRALHIRNRGAKARTDLMVLRMPSCPAFIAELGFLEADYTALTNPIYRDIAIDVMVDWTKWMKEMASGKKSA